MSDQIEFKIRSELGRLKSVTGYAATLSAAPNHNFGVHHNSATQQWVVTELSTGWAIPRSDAFEKEASIKNADRSIEKFNLKHNAFSAAVIVAKKHGMDECPL
jgi:hypothetical protein